MTRVKDFAVDFLGRRGLPYLGADDPDANEVGKARVVDVKRLQTDTWNFFDDFDRLDFDLVQSPWLRIQAGTGSAVSPVWPDYAVWAEGGFGWLGCVSGSSVNAFAGVLSQQSAYHAGNSPSFRARVKLPDVLTDAGVRVGFFEPADELTYALLATENSGKWSCLVASDASGLSSSTGALSSPVPTPGGVYELRVDLGPDNVKFYVDDTLIATLTTGRPEAGEAMAVHMYATRWANSGDEAGLDFIDVSGER